jgi:hypothetical protein
MRSALEWLCGDHTPEGVFEDEGFVQELYELYDEKVYCILLLIFGLAIFLIFGLAIFNLRSEHVYSCKLAVQCSCGVHARKLRVHARSCDLI